MSSKFDVQRIRFEPTNDTTADTASAHPVYMVAETFSIERRPETSLAITKSQPKYDAAWLPKSVAQIAVKSGVSTATIFGILLFAMLALYGAFTISTVNLWDTLIAHSLTGVASLSMIYGAVAIIGILLSLIEEEDPLRLVNRFMQYTGAMVLFISVFLIGGWVATQWIRSLLSAYIDPAIAISVGVVLLATSTQAVFQGLSRIYRMFNGVE